MSHSSPSADGFARWLEAHNRHIEVQRRLAIAAEVSRKMGTLPPVELELEAHQLGAEAGTLLAQALRLLERA